MKQIRKRFTYANVMSSIAVFLVLGGATAIAAGHLGKNTVGAKQLKANAVTPAKIKKAAVTAAKLKADAVGATAIQNNAITSAKIANGAITGEKVNLGTIGTVPNSATTNVIKGSKGTLSVGQEATRSRVRPDEDHRQVRNPDRLPDRDHRTRLHLVEHRRHCLLELGGRQQPPRSWHARE